LPGDQKFVHFQRLPGKPDIIDEAVPNLALLGIATANNQRQVRLMVGGDMMRRMSGAQFSFFRQFFGVKGYSAFARVLDADRNSDVIWLVQFQPQAGSDEFVSPFAVLGRIPD